jgi:hypothetical protein
MQHRQFNFILVTLILDFKVNHVKKTRLELGIKFFPLKLLKDLG